MLTTEERRELTTEERREAIEAGKARGREVMNAIYAEAERKTLKKMARKDPEHFMVRFRMLVDAATAETLPAMLEYVRSASVASDTKRARSHGRPQDGGHEGWCPQCRRYA